MPNSNNDQDEFAAYLARYVSGANPKNALTPEQAAQGAHLCFVNTNELLVDARILAKEGRLSRALSVTVLALEELAKISELYRVAIESQLASDAVDWKAFWKEFNYHKPKQKRATAYGNVIKGVSGEGDGLTNPLPYKSYFSDDTFGHLDKAKQKNFYVDFSDGKFVAPRNDDRTKKILSEIYGFVSERIDTFGSWHSSIDRNVDFFEVTTKQAKCLLESSALADSGLTSLNGWANTFTPEEVQADIIRLACYRSSGGVPDYYRFTPEMDTVLGLTAENREAILAGVVGELEARMDIGEVLPQFVYRAFCMFKLIIHYGQKNLSKSAFNKIFPKLANAG
ncbi:MULTISPECIES: AbiV family abortive infection protein [unclassified Halomonas]|uniref:AbiV family abortive infection protein n=1 Tax=unclassified Halomonas TaxID=2609666 RepID=UPI002885391E|nr:MULTISPECIES: AbiV family abortive infection protein [unclassified Halomonas]MDT0501582.1 AbiV family abortive infection protein [Halomonas sp. PAR7]MDT0511061.1 AbiV family abortive infection protein [Halomonas sp. LES1]MDT0592422.1 AbiV family abortive infection protein [Halomonas sp. PAR8]